MSLSSPAAPEPLTQEQQLEHDVALILQSALERHHGGDYDDARALYETILGALPAHADANYNLGVLKVQTGQAEDAIPHLEIAIGANSECEHYWVNYINALYRSGQTQAAWIAVELAQKRGIRNAELDWLITQMATPEILLASSHVEAVDIKLATAVPAVSERLGRNGAKAAPLKADPRKLNKHNALYKSRRFAEALSLARKLVAEHPSDGSSWRALTLSLHGEGHKYEVIDAASRALELLPDDFALRGMLADALRGTGRQVEAEAEYRRIINAFPDKPDGYRLLGNVLHDQKRYQEAAESCQRAVDLAPDHAATNLELGFALLALGSGGDAIKRLRRAIEIDPANSKNHSAILFRLTHSDAIDAATLLGEHCAFGKLHETRVAVKKHTNSRDPERRLQIGFVSGDLYNHAVATYLAPVVEHLANDQSLSLHFYSNYQVEDHVTSQLRAKAASWTDITGLNDIRFAEKIRRDEIDIVIDLSGHTDRNRLGALARKPAPIQASWLGYPGTTGLKAMDYYLIDRHVAPPGLLDGQFIEKIARLPAAGAFSAPENSPPVNALPAMHNGHVTYGSFNRMNKLSSDVIALWAKILRAMPHSRMVIGAIDKESDQKTCLEWFAAEGIGAQRLTFRPRAAIPVYLQQHHQVDICLDTFPYTGATTTINGLWMGVPTLTLAGHSVPSRGSVGWLSHLGLEQFIAHDIDDFVRRAIALSANLDALSQLRGSMRERCLHTAAFQAGTMASGLSAALRAMWKRWCAGEAPESFDITVA